MVLLGRGHNGPNSSKQTALFDIRIKGSDHDVLVIKGTPNDANSVLLSGTIVLSVLEPMNIKKLSLKLYSTLRLKWTNTYETTKGNTIKRPYRYERRIFEHNWDNFEIQNYLSNLYDNYGNTIDLKRTSADNSSSSLKSFATKKSKSASNLVSFGSSASLAQQSHLLLQGNYEFPFSAILPGSVLESVEGLPGASVIYKLQATIEKGRFANDLIAKKHLRIVRTLTPDAVELSETVAVDNTWPHKVEYSISSPIRAVAIGSSIPITMTLVPLLKGLKLGKIKINLVEYFSCSGSTGPAHNGDRTIIDSSPLDSEITLSDDRWEVQTLIQIPASLSKATQDVDIMTHIKVRHKLKFNIGLVNPDGHTSELRASLPIALFISPFVALSVKNIDRKDSVAEGYDVFPEIPSGSEKDFGDDDEVIFAPDPDFTPAMASSANVAHTAEIEREAPPNYENHIYDRLWKEILIEDTPDDSATQTPEVQTPNGVSNAEALNVNKLNETLRRLHIQRLNEQSQISLDSLASSGPSSPGQLQQEQQRRKIQPSFTLGSGHGDGDDDDDDDDDDGGITFQTVPIQVPTPINNIRLPTDGYFASHSVQSNDGYSPHPLHNGITSPSFSPGYNHISRVNSETNLSQQSGVSSRDWSSAKLYEVPSYQVAMKSPKFEDFSPAYEPADELTLPKSIHFKSSSLTNSRAQSTAYLSNLRGVDQVHDSSSNLRSKTSSSNSSPSHSRSASSTRISNTPNNSSTTQVYSKSPSKNKFISSGNLSFSGMTPLSASPPVSRSPAPSNDPSSTHRPSSQLSSHQKSSSFVNLMGNFMHKKDKK